MSVLKRSQMFSNVLKRSHRIGINNGVCRVIFIGGGYGSQEFFFIHFCEILVAESLSPFWRHTHADEFCLYFFYL